LNNAPAKDVVRGTRVCRFGFEANANRRKMKTNRDLIKGDASGIEQHETS